MLKMPACVPQFYKGKKKSLASLANFLHLKIVAVFNMMLLLTSVVFELVLKGLPQHIIFFLL